MHQWITRVKIFSVKILLRMLLKLILAPIDRKNKNYTPLGSNFWPCRSCGSLPSPLIQRLILKEHVRICCGWNHTLFFYKQLDFPTLPQPLFSKSPKSPQKVVLQFQRTAVSSHKSFYTKYGIITDISGCHSSRYKMRLI